MKTRLKIRDEFVSISNYFTEYLCQYFLNHIEADIFWFNDEFQLSIRSIYIFGVFNETLKSYYDHSYSVLVESLNSKTPLYYIVFFSNYRRIDEILPNLVNNIEKWKKEDFIRKYKYGISKPIDCYNKEESLNILEREKLENPSKN